ncbi:TetR/AcrR family transcriptional regulator [Granulicoccus phenolivorans]|uniref:TetR/AcrR family transcriptional regulator n=1 Tax=Granulicoccus phenolivorans TaxID=266854 RepID=UPI00040A2630|nr:TetR/AcrR family transcriptional regulator [Granulicoccus phenolivorans]
MSMPTDAPLSRTRIIQTAIALADRIGLAEMSMRRLGDELGVSAMALYRHLANRDELITAMVDTAIEPPPATALPEVTAPWRDRLRARILVSRARMLEHPWLPDAIRDQRTASPAALRYLDELIAILIDGGLPPPVVHNGMHALSTRMWGFTIEVFPTPALPAEQPALDRSLAEYAAAYPAMIAMATQVHHDGGCDADAEFAFALDILLAGIERAANP